MQFYSFCYYFGGFVYSRNNIIRTTLLPNLFPKADLAFLNLKFTSSEKFWNKLSTYYQDIPKFTILLAYCRKLTLEKTQTLYELFWKKAYTFSEI